MVRRITIFSCVSLSAMNRIAHIPRVLYHWRRSQNPARATRSANPTSLIASLFYIEEHMKVGESRIKKQ